MAEVTKAANAEADGDPNAPTDLGQWATPSNAYATTGDNVYSTAALDATKNSGRASRFGFPAFASGDIPDGSTINSVTCTVEWGATASATGLTLGVQLVNNGTPIGTETTKTSTTEAQSTVQVTSGISLTDLRTAAIIQANIRFRKGNVTTTTTGNLDFATLTVDYTEPAAPTTHYGASVLPLSLVAVVAGFKTTWGYVSQPLAVSLAANGQRIAFGWVVLPLSLGIVSTGAASGGSPPQYARPSADSLDGAWTTQAGGTDLAAVLDEEVADDADYIRSELQPDNSGCRVKIGSLGDPASSTGHRLHWRVAKDAADGATVNMTLKLYEGGGDTLGAGVLVASFTRNDVSEAFTTYAESLSGAEADSITDYSALYIEMHADVT